VGIRAVLGALAKFLQSARKKDKCAEGFGSETSVKWLSGDGEL